MNYIICTNLIKEKYKKNNIYLGLWALPDNKFLLYKKKKINKFLWANKNKFIKDSIYIKKTCLKLFRILYLSLNKSHKSQFSIRFWKILLFPWLYYYVSSLYFRWNCIKEIKKNNIFIFEKNLKLTKNDYVEDHYLFQNNDWNQKIFQDIVLFQNKKFLFQNKSNNKKNFVIKNIFYTQFFFFIIPTIVFNIFNYLIAIFKKNNFLFINTCYPENSSFSFFKNYKLNSYLKYFLEKFNPMFVNSGRRDYFVREKFKNFFTTFFFSKNKFEFFLKNKIYNDMPSYLLENFKNYLNRNFKINDSKAILTSYDLYSKFPNKFYIAEQVNKGAKLYLIEHGGSLTAQKETLDLDLDIVDKKITWFKPFNRKQSQIPTHPFHYLKIISKEKNNINKKNCILIGGGEYKHIWNSTYYLKPSQIIEQLENIKKFYNILDIKVKRKTFIKPHEGYTSDVTFDLIKYYVNIFNKKIIRKTSLEKCINSSKMVICVYPETTFALSMYSSVPTVLFYNKDHYIFHKQTDNLINILIKNNIIFYDPKLAAKHINKVWDNPVAWFNSTEVKKARNLFLKIALGIEFPRNLTKERKHWESILQ